MDDNTGFSQSVEDIDEKERVLRNIAPLVMIRGIIGILAGICLLFWPTTVAVAVVVLGVFLVADGVDRLVSVWRRGTADMWPLIGALLRTIVGMVIIVNPARTGGAGVSILFFIAGLHLVFSSIQSLRGRKGIGEDVPFVFMTIFMMILGLLMIFFPLVSALVMFRIIGGVLILLSVPALFAGVRLRRKS